MQATDEAGTHLSNKGDEGAINFRPSSNFKFMKKYCKGKVELSGACGEEEGGRSEAEDVKPPLPRDPPPPDTPQLVTPKEELTDDEECAPEEPPAGCERVMCRQFARGACTRGSACIFAHEIILSQLPGLYTFCRDYQNSSCTFSRCKFVHATVFEKECFYRTGYLPPHAVKHLKESTAAAAPAQPLPNAPIEGVRASAGACAEVPAAFPSSAAATAPASLLHPGMGCGAEARPSGEAVGALAAVAAVAAAALDPHYRNIDDHGAAAAREPARAEAALAPAPAVTAAAVPTSVPRAKCSNCDITVFRLQYLRSKKEKLARSVQDLGEKITSIDEKTAKQRAVIAKLIKQHSLASNGGGIDAGTSLFNNVNNISNRNDKAKAIQEKLNLLLSTNGGQAAAGDDNSTKINVLVRLLLSGSEDGDAAKSES